MTIIYVHSQFHSHVTIRAWTNIPSCLHCIHSIFFFRPIINHFRLSRHRSQSVMYLSPWLELKHQRLQNVCMCCTEMMYLDPMQPIFKSFRLRTYHLGIGMDWHENESGIHPAYRRLYTCCFTTKIARTMHVFHSATVSVKMRNCGNSKGEKTVNVHNRWFITESSLHFHRHSAWAWLQLVG